MPSLAEADITDADPSQVLTVHVSTEAHEMVDVPDADTKYAGNELGWAAESQSTRRSIAGLHEEYEAKTHEMV